MDIPSLMVGAALCLIGVGIATIARYRLAWRGVDDRTYQAEALAADLKDSEHIINALSGELMALEILGGCTDG